ncbi:hypothetical protein MAR_037950 [Mya arenaria]|uniref:Uncharacterized protein n=1 Tax=Mya arenaria TaxID=6604 RepID=A0ABY7FYU4_MYAAR|nr:hypothetical protein MAR_037950 [Mya arenaria]
MCRKVCGRQQYLLNRIHQKNCQALKENGMVSKMHPTSTAKVREMLPQALHPQLPHRGMPKGQGPCQKLMYRHLGPALNNS